MKKVIISGVNGQDGSYMAEYLLKNTNHIIIGGIRRTSQAILSNLKYVINSSRFTLHTLDLNDVHSVTQLIKNEKPDYFINFGASAFVQDSWNNPASCMETNAIALIHILEAVRQFVPDCRVYSAGSSEQFGDVKYSPQDEKHPMSPRSVYGVSKCSASHICKVYRESYGLYVVHGILFNHESERRQAHYVTRKITQGVAQIYNEIKEKKQFTPIQLGNIDAKRDWSHAEDFVDGIWRMLNQDTFRLDLGYRSDTCCFPSQIHKHIKEYVLSSGETHTIREFIELAFKTAQPYMFENTLIKDANLFYWVGQGLNEAYGFGMRGINLSGECQNSFLPLVTINPEFYRPADVETLQGDSSLARKELGWEPKISFQELVRLMVQNDLDNYGKNS